MPPSLTAKIVVEAEFATRKALVVEDVSAPNTVSLVYGVLVPIPTLPAKYAFPVVVAPPLIVSPPFCAPLPIVEVPIASKLASVVVPLTANVPVEVALEKSTLVKCEVEEALSPFWNQKVDEEAALVAPKFDWNTNPVLPVVHAVADTDPDASIVRH